MKTQRVKKVVSISEVQSGGGGGAWLAKHGNTIVTGLLLVAAVGLLIRWRMNSMAAARQAIIDQLHQAQATIDRLSPGALARQSPAELIRSAQAVETEANADLANILNSPDTDAKTKAQARLLRGNLYWDLANLPEMPGAATQPTLRLGEASNDLLSKAFDEYNAVAGNPEYAAAYDVVSSARLGLAAIAENRDDWVTARKDLEDVKNDPHAPAISVEAANLQLMGMIQVQSPIYVAPPQGIPAATQPTSLLPMGPFPTTMPIRSTTLPNR
jgi:hypothetical protein